MKCRPRLSGSLSFIHYVSANISSYRFLRIQFWMGIRCVLFIFENSSFRRATGGLSGRLAGGLAGWLAGWLDDWLTRWLSGWLAKKLAGRLDGWLVGWLAGWLVGCYSGF